MECYCPKNKTASFIRKRVFQVSAERVPDDVRRSVVGRRRDVDDRRNRFRVQRLEKLSGQNRWISGEVALLG